MKSLTIVRELVSESRLHVCFDMKNGRETFREQNMEKITLSNNDIVEIIEALKCSIDKKARNWSKHSQNSLMNLPNGCIYKNLNDKLWLTSARICELFRSSEISKNSGRLNVDELQNQVVKWLSTKENLTLALAWGQPKRNAGRLKTIGPYADMAEVFSVGTLLALSKSISTICGRNVKILVLSGGSRFYESLFTDSKLTIAYDNQRQAISNMLGGKGSITFQAFSDSVSDGKSTSITDGKTTMFDSVLKSIPNEIVSDKFSTILLNIDWDTIFIKLKGKDKQRPHGIQLPRTLEKWLELEADYYNISNLVRASIISISSPKFQSECMELFNKEDILEDAISYIHQVTWESTKKYIALQTMNKNTSSSIITSMNGYNNILRITVHEKRDIKYMPAIYTLGKEGGNQLSQHVMMHLKDEGCTEFGSYFEFHDKSSKKVVLSDDSVDKLFGWLYKIDQPLCLTNLNSSEAIKENMMKIFD